MSPSRSRSDSDADQHFMRLALELAKRGRGLVEPNPMVGCVIVRDGEAVGHGYHRQFGGPHAEVEALNSLANAKDASGATVYVTLEPCCHQGKTPPCSRTLISSGVARVVVALADPYPKVNGGGLRQLKEAGIATTVGVLGAEAEYLNAPYLKKVRTGKPWVTAKWAMTMDGRIATVSGQSQWITGETSRGAAHRLRGRVDAIAVGMGTVEADDPMLTARPPGPRIATRVVFCRHRLPSVSSKLVQTAHEVPLMLVIGQQIESNDVDQVRSHGADIMEANTDDPITMIGAALDHCGGRGMTNLMLEGGGELLASFFAADQIDECQVYIGAKAFGGTQAPGPIGGPGLEKIADAWSFSLISVDQFDDDLRAIYRKNND